MSSIPPHPDTLIAGLFRTISLDEQDVSYFILKIIFIMFKDWEIKVRTCQC